MKNGKRIKGFIAMLLAIATLLTVAGCGAKSEGRDVLEVISATDMSSVTEENGITTFTAIDEDGRSIRFQGVGIAISEEGLTLRPGAKLFSLDYIGGIKRICVGEEYSGEGSTPEYLVDFGFAAADAPSVEGITELAACLPLGSITGGWLDVSKFNAGFIALQYSPSNTEDLTVSELTVRYDKNEPQVFAKDLSGEAATLMTDYRINWDDSMNLSANMSADALALKKMEDPNVIMSDIIAGIDRGSIVEKDGKTFFSVSMSDGATVRFEAENIEIVDAGISICPESKITSLDALGKIYAYYPVAENWESYPEYSVEKSVDIGYGYTYSASKTSVESAKEVHTYGISGMSADILDGEHMLSTAAFDPNFVYIGGYKYGEGSFVLTGMKVYYDPREKVTAMTEAKFYVGAMSAYLEGDIYNADAEETEDPYELNLDYYLIVAPDTEIANVESGATSIWCLPSAHFDVGALRDGNGNEIDKATPLKAGYTLDLTVGDYSMPLEVPIVEQYRGASTMNDLVPYCFPEALGQMNALVVPVVWADQTDMANEDTLNLFRQNLGRVADKNGTVTDYTKAGEYSLSKYYDTASYGKMNITSFITDWYYSDDNFAEVWQEAPNEVYSDEIMDWVHATYPDMDWSKYDKDANGYIDSMIILNAGVMESDELFINSFSGAVHYSHTYYGDFAGTPDAPRVNGYVNVGYGWFKDGCATLVHEYAHNLGIIDYYDVNYSGIDAVGKLDMQSSSCGDWNAYSKLAVGWMQPTVVEGLASGESCEYTIGATAFTDDVIIIPAAGTRYDGPFGEYVMVDLLAMDGINKFATESFGLDNVTGVRISHVNASMEKRVMNIESKTQLGTGAEYTIGTVHYPNNYVASRNGKYNVEVIQAGGDNTFTDVANLRVNLSESDLFYAGDTFRASDYGEFFVDGRMDDGSDFGYTVEIVSIGTDASGMPQATVRVTAK